MIVLPRACRLMVTLFLVTIAALLMSSCGVRRKSPGIWMRADKAAEMRADKAGAIHRVRKFFTKNIHRFHIKNGYWPRSIDELLEDQGLQEEWHLLSGDGRKIGRASVTGSAEEANVTVFFTRTFWDAYSDSTKAIEALSSSPYRWQISGNPKDGYSVLAKRSCAGRKSTYWHALVSDRPESRLDIGPEGANDKNDPSR